MPTSKVMTMIEKMRPDLAVRIEREHAEGVSNETIAGFLTHETGINVGREIVRRWFKVRDDAREAAEAAQEAERVDAQ